jgi:hypothetical protein
LFCDEIPTHSPFAFTFAFFAEEMKLLTRQQERKKKGFPTFFYRYSDFNNNNDENENQLRMFSGMCWKAQEIVKKRPT